MTSRRIPIPLTFFVVLAVTIFLIVFFGAWAVSANTADRDDALAFGFVGGSSGVNVTTPSSSQLSTLESAGQENSGVDDTEDSWWAKGFLKACPFH